MTDKEKLVELIKQFCIGLPVSDICGCAMLDTNQFWNSNYCPNCGAKMDKEGG